MIDPQELSLSDLLAADHQFVVPEYQRPYAWTSRQVDELLGDLEGYVGRDPGLYLGTIILDASKKSHKRIGIVDGQQRLTSLFLLLMACRDRAKELQQPNMAMATQQVITFTHKITMQSIGMRLLASPSVQEAYDAMASSDWNGIFPKKVGKRAINRIFPIYKLMLSVMKAKDISALMAFQQAIYNTRVIRINIDSDEEAFSIFERTNDRGLDLEVSDLLKNYLHQQEVPEIKTIWKEIRNNAPQSMPKMLRGFYVSREGSVQKAELYKKLRSYAVKQVTPAQLATELREYSVFFALTRDTGLGADKVREFLKDFELPAVSGNQDRYTQVFLSLQALRAFNVTQAQPLVFAAMLALRRLKLIQDASAANQFSRLLKSLENFHFINTSVCSHTGNEVEKVYADMCEKFGTTEDFAKQTEEVSIQLRARLTPEATFVSLFREIEYARKTIPQLAYVFDRINNFGRPLGDRQQIFFPHPNVFKKSLNIEHIWPQNGTQDSKLRPLKINNIGNLLVISRQANSKLSNKPVADKVSLFRGELKNVAGAYPTIGEVCKLYDQHNSWDDKIIIERATKLGELGYKQIWKI
ncbi:hypothetical protein GCM10011507_27300 [Edaphobacter acidisoli]|uniref:DUF262 domain-containing protein n=2 Tax=Edaphobacter acidisoli TaxID=2040573 RepID=A0A916W854_9BACT|nr:hypothetical protein GCM10011507_27300 [Edaphobacter acidisoli]